MIIVADDLAPSETVQLNKDLVLSFVTVHGSVNSHTAILARTMSIPALIGTDIPLTDAIDGNLVSWTDETAASMWIPMKILCRKCSS